MAHGNDDTDGDNTTCTDDEINIVIITFQDNFLHTCAKLNT